MDVVLLPGLWLDASAGEEIASVLERAGHRAHPLRLPRRQSEEAEHAGVTLRFRVDSAVALIDSIGRPVVLVGRAGDGAVTDAVVGARPGQVGRIVEVTVEPVGDATSADDGPPADEEITVLDWSAAEVTGLEEALLATFDEPSLPTPVPLAREPRRPIEPPATGTPVDFPEVVLVDLRTGASPPYVRPEELGLAILAAVSKP